MESNSQVLLKLVVKYVLEGVAVAAAANIFPKKSLSLQEIVTLGLAAATTFLILDIYAPSVGISARTGAGFGIGFNTVNRKVEGFQDLNNVYSTEENRMKDMVRLYNRGRVGDRRMRLNRIGRNDLGDIY